mmetsp:Transcript_13688/g.19161  ORF Transcript_13688/g.19161 Transcript_13688/m.19161 type:complete len:149 (-) Transcript_13688:679-1125(-)
MTGIMFLCRAHCTAVRRMLRPGVPSYKEFSSPFSTGGTDPDEFRGPGGLTARQIFQAVQESKERDAATAADFFVAAATASKESNYKDPTVESKDFILTNDMKEILLQKMSTGELCSLLQKHSIHYNDCLEKKDLVARVVQSGLDVDKD